MSPGRLGVLLLAAGWIAAGPAAHAQERGIWDRRIDEDAGRETFTLTSRKPNYILVTSMRTPNQAPYEFTGSADRLFRGQELEQRHVDVLWSRERIFDRAGDVVCA